ncbi:hypothetical protein MKEN_01316500 [Mycena kentingensis (nom. inval.)]|nr:hypothetical protein MKEN_01316500 [Mycena kentingensis (nom. inval.)]
MAERSLVSSSAQSALATRTHVDTDARGSFFPNASNVEISGGHFESHVHETVREASSRRDYRILPFGDVDLRSEIDVFYSRGIVERNPRRGWARKVYSARVNGQDMVVALYRGGKQAETEWEKEVESVRWARHPSLFQLYGIASGDGIHAAIYHGDLRPLTELIPASQDALARVELVLQWAIQFHAVLADVRSILDALDGNATIPFSYFLRLSTGRLCLNLESNEDLLFSEECPPPPYVENPPCETTPGKRLVHQLPLREIHRLCQSARPGLGQVQRSLTRVVSPSIFWPYRCQWTQPTLGNLAAFICVVVLRPGDHTPLATIPLCPIGPPWFRHKERWDEITASGRTPDGDYQPRPSFKFNQNGWSLCAVRCGFFPETKFFVDRNYRGVEGMWVSQADYVHKQLRNTSSLTTYAPVNRIVICVDVDAGTVLEDNVSLLFAPPHLVFKPDTLLQRVAHWCISAIVTVQYPEAFYDELRSVHAARGFDPAGPEVAMYLGYPVFEAATASNPEVPRVEVFDEEWGEAFAAGQPEPVDEPDDDMRMLWQFGLILFAFCVHWVDNPYWSREI